MESPFQFGKTVSGYNFINREQEIKKLCSNFESGINTIIISPRRWGKSSLVEKTAQKLQEKNHKIKFCFIDMLALRSEEEFYEAIVRETIKGISSKKEELLSIAKEFLKKLIPKFSISIDPQHDFSVSFDWPEAKKHPDEILNLPDKISQKKGFKLIICIDEFQNIRSFSEGQFFEKKLRAYWQHHNFVTYCLFGSKRHMMSEIFNKKNNPFYRFGDLIILNKISHNHWIEFICKSFEKTQRHINAQFASEIAGIMKCNPYYVQQLSQYVWERTEKKVTEEILHNAIDYLLQVNNIFYEQDIESLSNTQINFLKAVTDNVARFTSVDVMQKYKLGTPRNVIKNKMALQKNDIIDVTGPKIEFLDPTFELWFKKYICRK